MPNQFKNFYGSVPNDLTSGYLAYADRIGVYGSNSMQPLNRVRKLFQFVHFSEIRRKFYVRNAVLYGWEVAGSVSRARSMTWILPKFGMLDTDQQLHKVRPADIFREQPWPLLCAGGVNKKGAPELQSPRAN
jgi:hypothetical protein